MTEEALPMDQALMDMFDQARKVVADADRRIAEEEERHRDNERQRLLLELSARVEDAFDFTSKEKLAFEPRLDVQDGVGVVEFVVRTVRAIFLLSPVEGNTWILQVVQEGYEPQVLCEFQGGMKTEQPSRRLAAARVVAALGNWVVQNARGPQRVQTAKQPRWREDDAPRPEPTFGTFLGHQL
jgi:hypothetical protein